MRPSSFQTPDDAPQAVDLTRIGRAVSRKRWWVMGPTLIAFVGAAAFVNIVKPRYTADARLLLENQENFLTRADKSERGETALAPDPEAVQSQMQLLTSRDLARRAIKTLELQGNEEFDPLAKGLGLTSRALILLGLMRDPTQLSPEERILTTFGDKLTVLSPTKTRVLSVEFSSRNPDLAARGANVVAESYIDMQQEAKRENARAAAQSLAALVADLRARVSTAESEVEAFRLKSGLLVGGNNTTIGAQQLGDINTQLSQSRAAQADSHAKSRILREMLRQNRIGDAPDIANNEFLRRINEQRVMLRGQLAMESRTLLPGHPRIKELQAQLDALDAQWRTGAERAARTLENDARVAGARVENLQHTLDEQKKVVGAADADDVRLRELDRAARALKEQLETAAAKYQEALARESNKATPADARIIQRALAPQLPSFPKKIPIVAIATFAGLALSLGVVIAGELLTDRTRAPEAEAGAAPAEIAPRRAAPLAAVRIEPSVPNAAPNADAAAPPPAPVDAPELRLRGQLEPHSEPIPHETPRDAGRRLDAARAQARSVKALLLNGDDAGTGVATALTLARGLAQRGLAVLVAADAGDAAYDSLAPARDAARPAGFSDLLAGRAAFSDIIHRDPESRLHVIAAGAAAELDAEDAVMALDALAQAYDFVVFATSSVDAALALASAFDSVMLHAPQGRAERLLARLAEAGVDAALVDAATPDQAAA
jgi:polysaccharide biosynthesis transport protein